VQKRIFGPKREEVTGGWRRLHKEELHNLYTSQSIIRVKKSRRMRWARHAACMGEMKNIYKILVGNLKGRNLSEYLGVDGSGSWGNRVGRCRLDSSGSG
jgi:hypothetical protein